MVVGTFVVLSGGSAQAATPWSGSFTSFTADTLTTDVNHNYAIASVDVSPKVAGGYKVSVYDDAGTRVCYSTSSYPTGCAFTSRPATNSSKSYTAYVALDTPTSGPPTDDVRATTGPLTITNIGWTGSFTSFTADTLTTDVNHDYAIVSAEVSPKTAGGYKVSVYDDDTGQRKCVSSSSYPKGCALTSRPPANTTKSYTAYVALDAPTTGPPTDHVASTAGPVTVTNVGWTGHFTSVDVVEGDEAFLGATSAVFTWDEPLEFVHIDIVDSAGDVITTCSTAGILDCAGARALGPEETEAIHAEARVTLPDGGYATVATSADAELTGMDPYAYADFLLEAPVASVVKLLGAPRAAQALAVREQMASETFCVALGRVLPSNAMFHSSVSDATLLCNAGKRVVVGFLIVTGGVVAALLILLSVDDTGTEPTPEPTPEPSNSGGEGNSQDPCGDAGPEDCNLPVFMPGADTPETTQHIMDALAENPSWTLLTKATNPWSTTYRKWYSGDPRCPSPLGDGLSCDEYPFYTSLQGGPPGASLRLVPGWEQNKQGGDLGYFYAACGVDVGDSFLVVPQPSQPTTTFVCTP